MAAHQYSASRLGRIISRSTYGVPGRLAVSVQHTSLESLSAKVFPKRLKYQASFQKGMKSRNTSSSPSTELSAFRQSPINISFRPTLQMVCLLADSNHLQTSSKRSYSIVPHVPNIPLHGAFLNLTSTHLILFHPHLTLYNPQLRTADQINCNILRRNLFSNRADVVFISSSQISSRSTDCPPNLNTETLWKGRNLPLIPA